MFELNSKYQIEIMREGQSIFYTGEILEEDDSMIRIIDKYNEERIINKNNIIQSKKVK